MRRIFFSLLFSIVCHANTDFTNTKSSYINYVKKIHLPSVFQPHNASIVPYEEGYLISFRIRNPTNRTSHDVGLIKLDDQFNPIGMPQILKLPFAKKGRISVQDPRLFWFEEQLMMTFSHYVTKKMYVAELYESDSLFYVSSVNSINDFDGKKPGRMEKNWMPFVHNNALFFVYSIDPHKILKYQKDKSYCTLVDKTLTHHHWSWGEMRGSTPCLPIGEYFLTFFHSSVITNSAASKGKKIPHYFIGAYLFENQPPFTIKGITSTPLLHPSFFDGDTSLPHKPLKVVFPCGYLIKNNTIYLIYGKQDSEVWIASIDLISFLDSMDYN